jgi:hypothetical protein
MTKGNGSVSFDININEKGTVGTAKGLINENDLVKYIDNLKKAGKEISAITQRSYYNPMTGGQTEQTRFSFAEEKEKTSLFGSIFKGVGKMAISLGILSAMWKGLEPLLRPVLTMMKAVFLMLFLPLIPLLKPFIIGMKKIMGDMVKAQEKVEKGGGDPMAQFAAGFGVLVSQGITKSISGLFKGMIGIDFSNGEVTDSSFLQKLLSSAGWGILAAGLAALFLSGGTALPLGAIVFSTSLGLKLLADATTEENTFSSIIEALTGSMLFGGIIATGIKVLLGGTAAGATLTGAGATAVATLAIGGLIFSFWMGLNIKKKVEESGGYDEVLDRLAKKAGQGGIVDTAFNFLAQGVLIAMQGAETSIKAVGKLIGSSEKGSFPLVYSLNRAITRFGVLETSANTAINSIIDNLKNIPSDIYTYHHIITVYEE